MGHLNYQSIIKRKNNKDLSKQHHVIHKFRLSPKPIKLSIILLDWSCRERFDPLLWLSQQNVPRDCYEIIWIELYDRIVPEVMEHSDVVITCHQQGKYHKHEGYNIGLLHAQGTLITVCDSDAIFPNNFVESILNYFSDGNEQKSGVLMHYEARTSLEFPEGLNDPALLNQHGWYWWPLHPNVGACMTVRIEDAIRFGGFDEHKSLRGYLCGPYELGWRLVNAGIPEYWHPTNVLLYHFAHPDPTGVQGFFPSFKQFFEMLQIHVDLHAWAAVEAFSSGRLLPLKENHSIFIRRMKQRMIGTPYEEKYAWMTGQRGFSFSQKLVAKLGLLVDVLKFFTSSLTLFVKESVKKIKNKIVQITRLSTTGTTIKSTFMNSVIHHYAAYNFYKFDQIYAAVPHFIQDDNRLKALLHSQEDLLQKVMLETTLEHENIILSSSVFEIRHKIDQSRIFSFKIPFLFHRNYLGSEYHLYLYEGMCCACKNAEDCLDYENRLISADRIHVVKRGLDELIKLKKIEIGYECEFLPEKGIEENLTSPNVG